MDDKLPDWATTPKSKGWLVQTAVEHGESTDQVADEKPGIMIGRNGQVCDIEVAHKSASRVHACIAFDKEQTPFVVDLGSTHGTFVDGEQLEKGGKKKLEPGKSIVTIGRCEMTVTLLHTKPVKSKDRGGSEKVNRKGEARPVHKAAYEDEVAELERVREHAREHKQRPDHDRFSHSLGFESRGAGREQHGGDDRYRQHFDANGRGRGMEHGGNDRRPHSSARDGGRGRGRSRDRDYDDSRHERDRPNRVAGSGRDHRRGQPGDRELPRSDYQKGRDYDAGRHGDLRSKHGPPPKQHDRYNGSSKKGYQDEVHRKRHSSDEDDKNPGERRQRQRKTGFDGSGKIGSEQQPAQTPAQIVKSMMGIGGSAQAPMTIEQKKKLLWGKNPDPEEPAPAAAFGANRWDTAEFSNAGDKDKFIKLMGVKGNPESLMPVAAVERPHSPAMREALTKDKQDRLLQDVEQHFMTGLRRADGRTAGLGL